jgi:hypothetical protein
MSNQDYSLPKLQILDDKNATIIPSEPSLTQLTESEKILLNPNKIQENLVELTENLSIVSKINLVNRLNFLNFQNATVQVNFEHDKYGTEANLRAFPLPCSGDELECVWNEIDQIPSILGSHKLKNLIIPAGNTLIKVTPDVFTISKEGLKLKLPEICHAYSARNILRQPCDGVSVHFIQSGYTFLGSLLDFTASSFRVKLAVSHRQTFNWISSSLPVNIIFYYGNESCYSGECKIQRHTEGDVERQYVLIPLKKEIQRYRKVKFRSQRQKPAFLPNIIFQHPLTKKRVELKVIDISGLGFSVEEGAQNPVLLPGLILPVIYLNFADIFSLKCSVQVVSSKVVKDSNNRHNLQCGLAILDIEAEDHIKLQSFLHHSKNNNCYVCNTIDLNELWDFFFETGFIYPKKYVHIQKEKEKIKSTYQKLYTSCPKIARHFIYQDNGYIMGHMGMIRFWENTWLIHHHAARKTRLNRAGLIVLDQMERLIYDSSRLKFMHMNYLICYYRPENKFPRRIFGGSFMHINNRKECSEDGYAFISNLILDNDIILAEGWKVQDAQPQDIDELGRFYEKISGGLMLKALDLEQDSWQREDLSAEFQLHGFERKRHIFSIKEFETLKAIIIVSLSDVGLNLSDLTNCLKIIVIDPENLSKTIFLQAVSYTFNRIQNYGLPVMVYPNNYLKNIDVEYDKNYILWSVDIQNVSDKYFSHLHRSLLDRL